VKYFITGTDTAVGKTYVSKLIIKTLRSSGINAIGFKPLSCGDRDDATTLSQASGNLPIDTINPIHFNAPLAPYVAALLENKKIDPAELIAAYHTLSTQYPAIIVEGAGGWHVPITQNYFTSDLAKDLNLPVIIVVANRLGAINHTLLTIDAIHAKDLTCAGIILNQLQDEMDTPMITNKGIIESLTNIPLLDHIIHNQDFISPELTNLFLEV
jgi:dethiobiotin synthetase